MKTLADVAKLAGVGVGTASRALSGRGYIDEETRQRVLKAASHLQYHGNAAARALRERRTRVIGLLVPDLTNEFYNSAAEVLQSELDVAGYQLIVAQTGAGLGDEQRAWESMISRQVDGVVHVPVDPAGEIPDTMPVVQLNRRSLAPAVLAVVSDDAAGVEAITTCVIDQGHRDIVALAGPENLSTTRDRLAGFRRAAEWAGLPEVPTANRRRRSGSGVRVITTEFTTEGGKSAIMGIADELPTAVVALSSRLVLGTLAACKVLSVSIPSELSVAGLGDPEWFSVWQPAITTYAPPLAEMGRRASTELLAAIQHWEDRPQPAAEIIRMSGELRVRDSISSPTR